MPTLLADDPIHERLVFYRKRQHLTIQEVASALGVSRTTVSHWEAGQTEPRLTQAAQLSQLYRVSVNLFLPVQARYAPPPTNGTHRWAGAAPS